MVASLTGVALGAIGVAAFGRRVVRGLVLIAGAAGLLAATAIDAGSAVITLERACRATGTPR